jgi:hypothetical protein
MLVVLMLSVGPGSNPVIDSSSTIALRNSLDKIRRSLTDDKAKTFDDNCALLILPATYVPGRTRLPESTNLYRKLHGCNAAEVQRQADQARQTKMAGQPDDEATTTSPGITPPPTAPTPVDPPRPIVGHVPPLDPNLLIDPSWVPQHGDTVYLIDPNGGMTYVCVDQASFELLQRAAQAKDHATIDDLLIRGKTFQAEYGTSAVVIELPKGSPTAIRVG